MGPKHLSKNSAVLMVFLVALAPSVMHGATYYVSNSGGDDARTCGTSTNIAFPKKTIKSGLGCVKAGDSLLIRSGTYPESINEYDVRIPSGADWNHPVTISGELGGKTILRPLSGTDVIRVMGPTGGTHHVIFNNLILDGANADGHGIAMTYSGKDPANAAHHIRVQYCEIINAIDQGVLGCGVGSEILKNNIHHNGNHHFDHGIYCSSKDLLVDGNDVHHNSGWGIHIYKENAPAGPGIIVRNNLSHDNARTGRQGPGMIIGGEGTLAYNNIVWNNYGGIQVTYSSPKNIKIFNNTIFSNRDWGVQVYRTTNTQIINNIIYENGDKSIVEPEPNIGLVHRNNFTVDPLFEDSAARNFRLKSGSQARDKGADLREWVKSDFSGTSRPVGPAFDIGAFEYGAQALTRTPGTPSEFTVR